MSPAYAILYYLSLLGPLGLGSVLLAALWIRASTPSQWSSQRRRSNWHPLERDLRNPLTISHGYRNIAASARLWHLAAAALVLTPIWIAPLALLAIGSANLADLDVAAGIFAWVAIELALTAVGGSIPFAR